MTEQRYEEGWRDDIAAGQLHDVDDTDHAVAVDFPHEVLDSYRTDWARGCWDEGFSQRLPVMVWNHDPNVLIGAGVRTESLGDRSRVIGRFANFDKVPKAAEVHSLLEDKIVPGWSFHYREGRTVAHPNVRGARRFVKARMLEFCPVTFPSIPGAQTAGLRAEEAILEVPTIDEILALQDRHLLDEEGVRAMIAEHHPQYRDHITVTSAPPDEPTATDRVATLLGDEHGLRDMVIRIGSDGTVTTDGPAPDGGADPGDDDSADAGTLAAATDAALDAACSLLEGVDVTTLPDSVQQAIALVHAAGVAVDELLDVLGIDDPDEDGTDGDRAAMSTEAVNDLPDDAFAYIEPGGTKDGSGKTVPRAKRHYPIHDKAHIRNALSRAGAAEAGDNADAKAIAAKALPKIKAAAKKAGIGDSGTRGDDAPDVPADRVSEKAIADTVERLNRRIPA